jgi:hypothetical protein
MDMFCARLDRIIDPNHALDELLSGREPQAVFSKDGLFDELKKALAERFLNAELDDHLGKKSAEGRWNHRNGYSKKTELTETSKIRRAHSARPGTNLRSEAHSSAIRGGSPASTAGSSRCAGAG